ncbi:hypothetical protein NC651_000103 [Populus alba x Populus x berolinensis]|nr:hypothetical protein NC651_000103 [Populus alba x Populus x berolinensis]
MYIIFCVPSSCSIFPDPCAASSFAHKKKQNYHLFLKKRRRRRNTDQVDIKRRLWLLVKEGD